MPTDDNNITETSETPAELLLEEIKKLRADNERLQKDFNEVKEFAIANTRRIIDGEPVSEPDDDEALNEVIEYYKKGYK